MSHEARQDAPRRNDHFVWRDVQGEIYILGDDGRTLRILNGTASALWKLCDGERSVEDLVSALADEYSIDPETARADTLEFLATIRGVGLLL